MPLLSAKQKVIMAGQDRHDYLTSPINRVEPPLLATFHKPICNFQRQG